jgi:chemotaxis protein histidine kinase CheA
MSDDGKGLDQGIRARAEAMGLLQPGQVVDDAASSTSSSSPVSRPPPN